MAVKVFPADNPEIDEQVNVFLTFLLWISGIPVTVVEAGTYKGDFAIFAGGMLRDMERGGKVFTADPTDFGVQERIEKEGLQDHIQYYQGDFKNMLINLHIKEIDFAFIDSGPLEDILNDRELFIKQRGVRHRHYQAVLPYMSSGGLVCVDDMVNIAWMKSERILEDADIFLKGARGLTIKQVK